MTESSTTRAICLLCIVSCLSFPGCGDDGAGKLYPVTGRILLDGQPLPKVGQGSVSFRGDASKGNKTLHEPMGVIEPDGRFELVTAGKKGAPAGWYKVLVFAFANTLEEGPVMPRKMLDEKYYAPDQTDLSIKVVEKPSPGAYDLTVTK